MKINRITQNLFLDGIEQREAFLLSAAENETNLIDNNIFWNIEGRFDQEKIPKEPVQVAGISCVNTMW